MIAAVRAVHVAYGTYDSYSWDELEDIGAYNIQDLALVLDGATAPPGLDRVKVGTHELRLIALELSIANWPDETAASAFHKVATAHRLIAHSA